MSGPQNLQATELTGASPRTKQYPPRIRSFITYVQAQYWSPCFILHNLLKTKPRPRRLLKSTWQLLLVILSKMKLPPYFGINSLSVVFWCRCVNDPIGCPTASLYRVTYIDPHPTQHSLQTLEYYPGKHTPNLPPIPAWLDMVRKQG